jgi:hypothetical protein
LNSIAVSAAFVTDAFLHHETSRLQRKNISERVVSNSNDDGALPHRDAACFIGNPKNVVLLSVAASIASILF